MRAFFRKYKRTIGIITLIASALVVLLILVAEVSVSRADNNRLFSNVDDVPAKQTALLLGTNKFMWDGQLNQYYLYRLDATTALWEAGKMEFVLISGDNSRAEYSEPDQMKEDLVAAGVPEDKIFLDYAGFRTWDSLVRAKEVFGQNELIIISQEFHNIRALYIAGDQGIDAVAFSAQDVPVSRSPRIWLRERLARVKALWDATVNTDPRFLGDPIVIE